MTDRTARTTKFILAALFAVLFLFSALRWNVGTDTWHTYTPEYLAMKARNTELTQEEKDVVDDCYRLWSRIEKGTPKEDAERLTLDCRQPDLEEIMVHLEKEGA